MTSEHEDIGGYGESDTVIEARMRAEMAMYTTIKMRVPGPYEIAALLRQLDRVRAMLHDRAAIRARPHLRVR